MGSNKPKACCIGLLVHAGHEHMRQIALGAVEFHRENPAVQIIGDGSNPLIPWNHLNQFTGNGLIAIANSHEQLNQLKHLGIPFVLAGARFLMEKKLSVVASDNLAIGKLAGEHLVSCGLRKFLYLGPVKWDDEKLRYQGFRDFLKDRQFVCKHGELSDFEFSFQDATSYGASEIQKLVDILKLNGVGPIGVFCPNSFIGRAAIQACNSIGLQVPDQVAVVAVNDDPILCETSDPPMSTIVQASNKIGFQAARLLAEQLLDGASPKHIFFAPKRLSVRRSTDLMMVGNETVEMALRYMRDHAQNSIEIREIADHVGVSRRTLELKFKETLTSTPGHELLRMRLEIAKTLLGESKIPITEIALRSGFGSSQVFSAVFKKACEITPTQYRAQARLGSEVV